VFERFACSLPALWMVEAMVLASAEFFFCGNWEELAWL
jgi:hypothetical protein